MSFSPESGAKLPAGCGMDGRTYSGLATRPEHTPNLTLTPELTHAWSKATTPPLPSAPHPQLREGALSDAGDASVEGAARGVDVGSEAKGTDASAGHTGAALRPAQPADETSLLPAGPATLAAPAAAVGGRVPDAPVGVKAGVKLEPARSDAESVGDSGIASHVPGNPPYFSVPVPNSHVNLVCMDARPAIPASSFMVPPSSFMIPMATGGYHLMSAPEVAPEVAPEAGAQQLQTVEEAGAERPTDGGQHATDDATGTMDK